MAPHSILAIDDSPDNLDIYRDLFSIDGYRVHTASTFMSARQAFKQHRPPVVLIDNDPEGIHASVIAAQLEQDAAALSERAPVFIAVRGDMLRGEEAQLARMKHVLTKPVDFAELDRILHDSVESWLLRSTD